MIELELIKNILLTAIAASVITTATVQKIKECFIQNKKVINIVSLFISLVIGTLFAKCFSDLSWINSLWVALITFIGADLVYKALEDKVFKSFSDIKNVNKIERTDKNE